MDFSVFVCVVRADGLFAFAECSLRFPLLIYPANALAQSVRATKSMQHEKNLFGFYRPSIVYLDVVMLFTLYPFMYMMKWKELTCTR